MSEGTLDSRLRSALLLMAEDPDPDARGAAALADSRIRTGSRTTTGPVSCGGGGGGGRRIQAEA
ncbi:MAG: hypothetical protein JF621_19480 [Streptomyces turgidiscabies]|nr:hypothetical protein [Streptomyces turgidiscabies]